MTKAQLEDLVRRLEGADRLSNAERLALLGDIERYARRDLYHAARLCKDHLNQKANLRLPTPIMAADQIEKHFERHTKQRAARWSCTASKTARSASPKTAAATEARLSPPPRNA
ncbi:hypothetical protein WJ973_25405 [Achromobacter xylosoxidans]